MDAQRGIARRMLIGLPPEGLTPAWERDFASFPPAGVIVFSRDFKDADDLRRLTRRLRELAKPRRLFLAIDEEGGWVSYLAPHFVVPPNATLLARGARPGDVAWVHQVTARRLRSLGLDWNFAPVADVHSQAHNPVIGPRAFGTEAASVSHRVGEALEGLAAGGVLSCLKHFPGHGDTVLDSHLTLPVCEADRATLEARELPPFRDHLAAPAIMVAHVVYPALDPGTPASFSRAITHDVLRGTLGYRGVAITDALEMKGASEGRGPFEIGRRAIEAGNDLLMFAHHSEDVRRARLELADALVEGTIDRALFDAARPRLLAFDAALAPPSEADLEVPVASLTPHDWEPRLSGIIERGLVVQGGLDAGARRLPLRVHEPEFAYGPPLRETLAAAGAAIAGEAGPAIEVFAVASRVPVTDDALAAMRAACARGPTVVLGLQNDAFLDALPAAALRISAADCTPLTRRVVSGRVGEALRSGA